MTNRAWLALILLPALAACGTTASAPQGPAVIAQATKVNGRISGAPTAPTSLKPVYNGNVRGDSIPVTNGTFDLTLPAASAINAQATAITSSTFGDDAACAGNVSYSNRDAKVVFLNYIDLFSGPTFVGYAGSARVQGDTINTYVWIYATAATEVKLQESCTQNGKPTTDTVHLRLVAGWNSTVGADTSAADGRVVRTWYTQPVGEAPWLYLGSGTTPTSLR